MNRANYVINHFLKNTLSIFLILHYIILNYVETYLSVKFEKNFMMNMYYAFWLGLYAHFGKEIVQVVAILAKNYKIIKVENKEQTTEMTATN